jgi:hypothetical protein
MVGHPDAVLVRGPKRRARMACDRGTKRALRERVGVVMLDATIAPRVYLSDGGDRPSWLVARNIPLRELAVPLRDGRRLYALGAVLPSAGFADVQQMLDAPVVRYVPAPAALGYATLAVPADGAGLHNEAATWLATWLAAPDAVRGGAILCAAPDLAHPARAM